MSSQTNVSISLHLDLIYLPVDQRTKLCAFLDQNDQWMELGAFMQFPEFDLLVSESFFKFKTFMYKFLMRQNFQEALKKFNFNES
jgi:hypothetical protein